MNERLQEFQRKTNLLSIWPWSALHRAITAGDAGFVRGYITGAWGVEVSDFLLEKWLQQAKAYRCSNDWRMWLKKRIEEAGLFPFGSIIPSIGNHPSCLLHVGFISIEETEDQLAMLRRKPAEEDDAPRLATPGIERTQVVLSPIDRTAAKVIGGDQ